MRNKIKSKMIIITLLALLSISISTNVFAATDQAGVFSTQDFVGYYGVPTVQVAKTGIEKLGYSVTHYNESVSSKSTVMDYINTSGKNYCLYLKCHASPTVLAIVNESASTYISQSEISGNWHFVFLDGCSTAADDGWANAFNTVGYSNRAFLGWYQTVWTDKVYDFSLVFWDEVGTKSLRDAALSAASSVPESGSTPIRMYGDKTWWGAAW